MRTCAASMVAVALLGAALAVPVAHAAADGKAIATALARDAVPPEYKGKARIEILTIPPAERAQGVVGAILLSLPAKGYLRYFVFDTQANAQRGYRRYVQEPWGGPMQRVAQDEMKPAGNLPRGDIACELQRNAQTGLYAGACLHFNAAIPVLVRGTLPVKFDDRLKLADRSLDQARKILAASEALDPTGAGARHAARVSRSP